MSATKSNIEWTDTTWNPTTGCSKVSPGCAHCYAETLTQRYAGAKGWPTEFLPWTPANAAQNVVLHPDRLEAPFSWRTPRRVFVNSMSDLFHEEIPDEFIDKVFAVMALTPQHTYQVLTKRPERMREYMTERKAGEPEMLCGQFGAWARVDKIHYEYVSKRTDRYPNEEEPIIWPLPNVWLGVTVENQRWADERIPILLDTPAAVRFLSCEPMLGEIDVAGIKGHPLGCEGLYGCEPKISWVICGGESGHGHRPFKPEWARDLHEQCAGVAAFFMKQLGGARPGTNLEDLPEDLRVREYPR